MSEQHAAKVCFCSIGRATFVQCSQPEFKEKYLNQLQTSTKLVVTHSTNVGDTDFGLRSRTDSRAAVLHMDRDSQAPACTRGASPREHPLSRPLRGNVSPKSCISTGFALQVFDTTQKQIGQNTLHSSRHLAYQSVC